MDVIGHQAPCEKIAPVVGIAEERLQTPVATLGDVVGDMVGNSRDGDAGGSGHELLVAQTSDRRKNI